MTHALFFVVRELQCPTQRGRYGLIATLRRLPQGFRAVALCSRLQSPSARAATRRVERARWQPVPMQQPRSVRRSWPHLGRSRGITDCRLSLTPHASTCSPIRFAPSACAQAVLRERLSRTLRSTLAPARITASASARCAPNGYAISLHNRNSSRSPVNALGGYAKAISRSIW
jgi:hypothetical protein